VTTVSDVPLDEAGLLELATKRSTSRQAVWESPA
jgi:hypothetical protein